MAGICKCNNEPSGFHKLRGNPWLAENRLASQEGLYSMEEWINGVMSKPYAFSCFVLDSKKITF